MEIGPLAFSAAQSGTKVLRRPGAPVWLEAPDATESGPESERPHRRLGIHGCGVAEQLLSHPNVLGIGDDDPAATENTTRLQPGQIKVKGTQTSRSRSAKLGSATPGSKSMFNHRRDEVPGQIIVP